MQHLPLRLKRLRQTEASRAMLQETHLHVEQLIAPLFVSEKIQSPKAINAMPGVEQLPLSCLAEEALSLHKLGIRAVLLFGIPQNKDTSGDASCDADGIIQQAIQLIKQACPEMLVIADVCLCEYTSHGHCGVLDGAHIDNDKTLEILANQAVSFAKAGADWVAPSSMTDGAVQALRTALDTKGFQKTGILSYAVKYASTLYGPFREAAEGAPQFGDRKTYQMNIANSNEALREASLDIEEGADILMVKPAQFYLDVIQKLKQNFIDIPLCAYQVSGEFAMIKAAAAQGMLDEEALMLESLLSIKRAGADLIITYFAKPFAALMQSTHKSHGL